MLASPQFWGIIFLKMMSPRTDTLEPRCLFGNGRADDSATIKVLTFVHVYVRSQFSSTIKLFSAVFAHERITSLSGK